MFLLRTSRSLIHEGGGSQETKGALKISISTRGVGKQSGFIKWGTHDTYNNKKGRSLSELRLRLR